MENLFSNIPDALPEELFEDLAKGRSTRIERIVSLGQSSPAEGWYDQAEAEWVCVLRGAARLEFEDGRIVEMGPGDFLNIQARERHRVAWTTPEEATVWLAVFYEED